MSKKNNPAVCIFCGDLAARQVTDELEYLSSNKGMYLCSKCFTSFSAGSVMGQFQLNNKILSLIMSADDKAPVLSLKQKIIDYAPASKSKLFSGNSRIGFIPPYELYEFLGKKVIGQDNAKRRISLTVYEHLRNLYDYQSTEKYNILLLGPSGSGKTLIANSISKKLEVPYVPTDATSFSPTGFQGADSENCIHELYLKADGDVDIAQKGVVFIDEIDKLASNNTGTRLESFNYSTQSTLLKLIEGKKVKLPASITGEGGIYHVDTSKILFIFGGAFNGLENIIGKNKGIAGNAIGFRGSNDSEYDVKMRLYEMYSNLSHDELVEGVIQFGLSPELVGRIQSIVPLKPLDRKELLDCLLNLESSPLRRNKMLFAESNVNIEFTEEFYEEIISKAVKAGTGARALNSLVKASVSVAAFEFLGKQNVNQKNIVISKDCVHDPSKYEVA